LTCDLIALIFDSSACGVKGHPYHGLLSLPIFSLPRPSILDLGLGTGQTDRLTDDEGGCIITSSNLLRFRLSLTVC